MFCVKCGISCIGAEYFQGLFHTWLYLMLSSSPGVLVVQPTKIGSTDNLALFRWLNLSDLLLACQVTTCTGIVYLVVCSILPSFSRSCLALRAASVFGNLLTNVVSRCRHSLYRCSARKSVAWTSSTGAMSGLSPYEVTSCLPIPSATFFWSVCLRAHHLIYISSGKCASHAGATRTESISASTS